MITESATTKNGFLVEPDCLIVNLKSQDSSEEFKVFHGEAYGGASTQCDTCDSSECVHANLVSEFVLEHWKI